MSNFQTNVRHEPATISERLLRLRNEKKLTLADVATLFNVNKSTVSRWETNDYWEHHDNPNKRLLLLQLVELYQADYAWVLNGKPGSVERNNNILVIDDDVTSLSIMTLIIRSIMPAEFELISFTRPDEALSWAVLHSAALVFCDYRMPRMQGDAFISRLRLISGYETIPVIAITQVREEGMPDLLLDAGATHVLQKPISQEKLQDILRPYELDCRPY